MAEISKIEYVARTQAVAKAATDFGLAWRQLSSACDTFGISKDEFEKKLLWTMPSVTFWKSLTNDLVS